MKRLTRFFLILVLLATLVYIGIHFSREDESSESPVKKPTTGQPSSLHLKDSSQEKVLSEVETINQQPENAPAILADENQSLLQAALAGELAAVMDFQKKMVQCRNKDYLVEAAREQSKQMKAQGMPEEVANMLEAGFFVRAAENKKNMCDQFYQQLNVNQPEGITDEETNLRVLSSIIDAADTGNPMARLLYALWAPTDRQSFLVGTALLEYEQRAMEYTLLNKVEEPQLALFALGRSYTGQGYFTPYRRTLGGAYLVASGICGLNDPVLDQTLSIFFTGQWAQRGKQGLELTSNKEVNEQALNIANEFCPDFLLNSTPGLR